MKRVAFIVIALGMAVFAPGAHACFCVIPEVPEAFDSAKAVFLGEVTDIVDPKTSNQTAPLRDRLFIIKFKVVRAWKGTGFVSQEISVLADQSGHGCFAYPPFQKGLRYLVYANPVADEKDWAIILGCNRTIVVGPGRRLNKIADSDAIDPYNDMKELDALPIRPRTFDGSSFRRQDAFRKFRW